MDIDLSSVIISILALSSFFVPIYYSEVYKKRTSKTFEAYFMDQARQHNISLAQYDSWRDYYAIGMDENAGNVCYLKKKNGQNHFRMVALSGIKKCRVSKTDSKVKTPNGEQKVTNRVELAFMYENSDKADEILEFYTDEYGDTLRNEVPLAGKWSSMINSKLNH